MHFEIPGFLSFSLSWYIVIPLVVLLLILTVRRFNRMKKEQSAHEPVLTGAKARIAVPYQNAERALEVSGPVALIVDVAGPILNEARSVSPFARSFATFGGDLGEALKSVARQKKKVGAVIVRLSTPGGTVTGSDGIARGIEACNAAGIPTYAYVSDMSASGGVWAMVAAKTIVAHPDALLGSIGVRGPQLFTYEDVTEMGGGFGNRVSAKSISAETISEGKGKTLGDPFSKPDPEALQRFKDLIKVSYDRFVNHVARYRGIDALVLKNLGAAIISAQDAHEIKLIDHVGDFDVVRAMVTKQLKCTWEECTLVHLRLSTKERLGSVFAHTVLGALQVYAGASKTTPHEVLRAETITAHYSVHN
jgi:protease-4